MSPIYKHQRPFSIFILLFICLLVAGAVSSARAAAYTYTPASTTTDNWSAGTHWNAVPVSGSATTLTFVGNNSTVLANSLVNTSTNNIGVFQLNTLSLQGTGPASGNAVITINSAPGDSLDFVSNGVTTPVVNLNASFGSSSLTYNVNSNIVLTNNTLFTGSGIVTTFNFSGTISGGGSLSKSGSSALILNGANTYTGGTILNAGNVTIGTSTSLGTGTVSITGTSLLSTSASVTSFANAINIGNGLTFTIQPAGTSTIFSGVISDNNGAGGGTGALSVSTFNNTLVLTGSNTYGGTTTISTSGGLQLGNGGNTGSVAGSIVDNSSLTFSRSDNALVISKGISGNGSVSNAGPGTVTLAGTNTYASFTSVGSGTLLLDFSSSVSPSSNIINNSANSSALFMGGGTLVINGGTSGTNSQRFKSLTVDAGSSGIAIVQNGASGITLNLGTVSRLRGGILNIVLPSGDTLTTSSSNDSGGLLGAGITINGNDWATVSGSNIVAATYTINNNVSTWAANQNISNATGSGSNAYAGTVSGTLTINSLKFDNASSGTVAIAAGSTLTINDGILLTPTVGNNASVITGGTLKGAASNQDLVVINNDLSSSLTISSVIADNSLDEILTKSGAGTLILTGKNTYEGGNYIYGGTVQLSGSGTIGVNSASSIGLVISGSGSTLDLGATTQTVAGLSMANGAAIQSTGGPGTLQMTSATTFSGSGNLIGNGTTLSDAFGYTIAANSSLTLNGTISQGAVNVYGVLGGSGKVASPSGGTVTVQAGGSTFPGISGAPARLSLDLAYSGSSTAQFMIGSTTTPNGLQNVTAGTDYDQIIVSGSSNPTLTIAANVTLQLNLATGALNVLHTNAANGSNPYSSTGPNAGQYNYFVFSLGSGTSSGQFTTLTLDINNILYSGVISYSTTNSDPTTGGDRFLSSTIGDVIINGIAGPVTSQEFAISYTGNMAANSTTGGNDIVLTAVPEPDTALLLGCGLLLIAFSKLRRLQQ